ncbi:hypothetical protein [Nonomuraea fuscirosea]|uniref:hypothetical protein n=1 Tax=Nonomuraea fuscirosea TaxID=1291556 RepID=UPI003431241E
MTTADHADDHDGRTPSEWLTIPDILFDLDVTPGDWRQWETEGHAPSGVIFPDGQVRISRLVYQRWLDNLPSGDAIGPISDPETIRSAIQHALKLAGARGLAWIDLTDLFGAIIPGRDLDKALRVLLRAGQCTAGEHTTTYGTEIRYCNCGESR